jgi:hypothetical protein
VPLCRRSGDLQTYLHGVCQINILFSLRKQCAAMSLASPVRDADRQLCKTLRFDIRRDGKTTSLETETGSTLNV